MVTKQAILKVAPDAEQYADELLRQMPTAGIVTPLRAARFLGQIAVESGGFTTVVESLNYSAKALKTLFGRHRISIADADKFGRTSEHAAHQNALANILYGGAWGKKNLGNTEPGDGWKFRGRGLKQLTGRDNYRRFSQSWLGSDELLHKPERVADPDGAVASAIWFWRANGLNAIADTGSVEAVTLRVNGGSNGLLDRKRWTAAFLNEFEDG
jgi:putative chitinase